MKNRWKQKKTASENTVGDGDPEASGIVLSAQHEQDVHGRLKWEVGLEGLHPEGQEKLPLKGEVRKGHQ